MNPLITRLLNNLILWKSCLRLRGAHAKIETRNGLAIVFIADQLRIINLLTPFENIKEKSQKVFIFSLPLKKKRRIISLIISLLQIDKFSFKSLKYEAEISTNRLFSIKNINAFLVLASIIS